MFLWRWLPRKCAEAEAPGGWPAGAQNRSGAIVRHELPRYWSPPPKTEQTKRRRPPCPSPWPRRRLGPSLWSWLWKGSLRLRAGHGPEKSAWPNHPAPVPQHPCPSPEEGGARRAGTPSLSLPVGRAPGPWRCHVTSPCHPAWRGCCRLGQQHGFPRGHNGEQTPLSGGPAPLCSLLLLSPPRQPRRRAVLKNACACGGLQRFPTRWLYFLE